MAKNYLAKLQALEGAVVGDYNPHNHVIRSPSPGFNFTFGKGWGLPLGYTLALGGPGKAGKSLISYAMTGQLHQDDPDAFVIKFDTEWRERGQLSDEMAKNWGIDKERYICFAGNDPELIFDRLETEVAAMCEDGMKLRLVIIDSLTNIKGRRSMNTNTVMTQNIGDQAQTVKIGLQRVQGIQKKYNYAQILTTHVSAEMDPVEQMRGNKVKMNLPFYAQHFCEYFMFVERNQTKAGRTDLSGNEFKDEERTDMADNGEQTGHKIIVKMKDSSLGPKGRKGEFTINYDKGIVNVHEEVFTLAKNRGILQMPNNRSYVFKDKTWTSKEAMLTAIKDDSELQKAILDELKRQDMAGKFKDIEE